MMACPHPEMMKIPVGGLVFSFKGFGLSFYFIGRSDTKGLMNQVRVYASWRSVPQYPAEPTGWVRYINKSKIMFFFEE